MSNDRRAAARSRWARTARRAAAAAAACGLLLLPAPRALARSSAEWDSDETAAKLGEALAMCDCDDQSDLPENRGPGRSMEDVMRGFYESMRTRAAYLDACQRDTDDKEKMIEFLVRDTFRETE